MTAIVDYGIGNVKSVYRAIEYLGGDVQLTRKYEELKKDPFETFKEILNFISQFKKIEIDDEKIHKIIKKCEFENLQNQEKRKGFKERKGKDLFFRKGEIDEWKNKLPNSLNELIKKNFNSEMQELGYF